MSCDLSDPTLLAVYEEILQGDRTQWMVAGYRDTRDIVTFYGKGPGGFNEMRDYILAHEEVLYGLLRFDQRLISITFIHEKVNSVKRARALVHSRAIGHVFKESEQLITINGTSELDETTIHNKLNMTSGTNLASPRISSEESAKSTSESARSEISPVSPQLPPPPPAPSTGSNSRPSPPPVPSSPRSAAAGFPNLVSRNEGSPRLPRKDPLLSVVKGEVSTTPTNLATPSKTERAPAPMPVKQEPLVVSVPEPIQRQDALEEKSMKRNVSVKQNPAPASPSTTAPPEPSAETQSFMSSLFSSFTAPSDTKPKQEPVSPTSKSMTRSASEVSSESKKPRARSATTTTPTANLATDIVKVGGFVTVHQSQYNVWKRRYFVFNGTQMQLYSTAGTIRLMEQVPIRDLSGVEMGRGACEQLSCVANSLKLCRKSGEPLLVYCDDRSGLNHLLKLLQANEVHAS